MTISTKPIAQLIIVARAGASSVTRTKGTGSQLRLRNSTPPRRAAPLRSASDCAGDGACGAGLDDMARKLVVEQRPEELRNDGVERRRPFDVGEMAGALEDLEPAAGDALLDTASVF